MKTDPPNEEHLVETPLGRLYVEPEGDSEAQLTIIATGGPAARCT
jgi:hypothetical protein